MFCFIILTFPLLSVFILFCLFLSSRVSWSVLLFLNVLWWSSLLSAPWFNLDVVQVWYGERSQLLPDNPERFDRVVCVLGREEICSGRHYWEVQLWLRVHEETQLSQPDVTRTDHGTLKDSFLWWRSFEEVFIHKQTLNVKLCSSGWKWFSFHPAGGDKLLIVI